MSTTVRHFELTKLFPLTARALAGRFAAHLRRFTEEHPPGGIERLFGDALGFAAYLEGRLIQERVGSGWVLDLLHYEKARLKAADPARRFVMRVFRHDISRLVRSVARREQPPAAIRRRTVAVWWRPQRRGVVRYTVFAAPRLLKRSD